jgi:hypothetical protein
VAVINTGNVTVDSVGQHAGTIQLGTGAGNNAALSITGGWLKVEDAAVGPANGEVVIGANAAATAALNLSGGKLTAKTLTKGAGGSFNFTGGVLSAETVNFDLVNNGGTIAPGQSPGLTQIMGDLTLNDGVLEIEIGGTAIGQFDRVEVHGVTTLGGTLKVELIDLNTGVYEPQLGDTFGFLAAYGGGGGTFDALDLPELSPGLDWAVLPGDVTYFLSVVAAPDILAGDYNDDDVVDAADYVVWLKLAGTGGPLPNETRSLGVIDDEDYDAWYSNFGATSSGNSAGVSTPEPMTAWLVAIGMFSLMCFCRSCGVKKAR